MSHINIMEFILGSALFTTSKAFYILYICFGYWLINKRLYKEALTLLLISAFLNAHLKELFTVAPMPEHHGWRFPSGHMQTACAFWGWIAYKSHHKIMTSFVIILLSLIGVGLVFFGHHLPIDVIVSVLIALLSIFIFDKALPKIRKRINDKEALHIGLATAIIFSIWYFIIPGVNHSHLIVPLAALVTLSIARFHEHRYSAFTLHTSILKNHTLMLVGIMFSLAGYYLIVITFRQSLGINIVNALAFSLLIYFAFFLWPYYMFPRKTKLSQEHYLKQDR